MSLLRSFSDEIAAIVARVRPAVLHLRTHGRGRSGTGSGFVVGDGDLALTNHHVAHGAANVEAIGHDGRTLAAEVLGSDPATDLALLRVPGLETTPLVLGDSNALRVGDFALAIGCPHGLSHTVTAGILSGLGRALPGPGGQSIEDVIQTDAPLNPGNSGGPLLDSAGRLIGVTTAIYSPSGASAGIGFAVPVDTVNAIVPRLLGGKSTTAILGVKGAYDYPAYRLDPDLGFASGAIVTEVQDGYGAAAAGLRPFRIRPTQRGEVVEQYGDVIVAIDDKPVRSFDELPRALSSRKPGDVVRVLAVRGLPDRPETVELRVQLSAQGEGVRSGT